MSSRDEVTVAVFRTRAAADLAIGALRAAGIPSWIDASMPSTRVALRVASADAAEAREVLAASTLPPSTPGAEEPRIDR